MSTCLKSSHWLWLQALSLASLCWLPTQSRAISERLDDTASPRNRVVSQTVLGDQGRLLAQTASGTLVTLKFGRINYKLATARFIGKNARIYYVVPLAIAGLRSPAGLKVEWRGHGIFSNGQARPGERSIVWTGTVHEAWMLEGLDVTMQVDLREINLPPGANFGFESYFEIETLP
jgi:hypothetical protein